MADFTAEELAIRVHLDRSRVMIGDLTEQLAALREDVSAADEALERMRGMRRRGIHPTRLNELDPTGCQCDRCSDHE